MTDPQWTIFSTFSGVSIKYLTAASRQTRRDYSKGWFDLYIKEPNLQKWHQAKFGNSGFSVSETSEIKKTANSEKLETRVNRVDFGALNYSLLVNVRYIISLLILSFLISSQFKNRFRTANLDWCVDFHLDKISPNVM